MNTSVSRFSSVTQLGSLLKTIQRTQRWFSSNPHVSLRSRYARRVRNDLNRLQRQAMFSSSRSYVTMEAPAVRTFEPHPLLQQEEIYEKSQYALSLDQAYELEMNFSEGMKTFRDHITPGPKFNFVTAINGLGEAINTMNFIQFPEHEAVALSTIQLFSTEYANLSVRQQMGLIQYKFMQAHADFLNMADSIFKFSKPTTPTTNDSETPVDPSSQSPNDNEKKDNEKKDDEKKDDKKDDKNDKEKKEDVEKKEKKSEEDNDKSKKSTPETKSKPKVVGQSSPAYDRFINQLRKQVETKEDNLKSLNNESKNNQDDNNSKGNKDTKSNPFLPKTPFSLTQIFLFCVLFGFLMSWTTIKSNTLPIHAISDFIDFVTPCADLVDQRRVVFLTNEKQQSVQATMRFPTLESLEEYKEIFRELGKASIQDPTNYEEARKTARTKVIALMESLKDVSYEERPHRLLINFEANHEDFAREMDHFYLQNNIPKEDQFRPLYNVQHSYFGHILTFSLIALIAFSLFRRGAGGMGGMPPGFGGQAKGKFKVDESARNIRFKDVAGMDEAKFELMEFVSFLKDFRKYRRLGARIPKGALLVGPPGTGKTLLAKAMAGESGVSFYSLSGSDFVEMFVGVGASRVRELFAEARKNAPAIIFIDEIDAIGRERSKKGSMGGNDERENTLNQILVEMDGFTANENVVVLASTNRVDILDKALLRPGRFDRQVTVDRPDIHGRRDILKVHLGPLKLNGDIDEIATRVAALTPGMVGADLSNVCNEAAIHAARLDKDAVELIDFEKAVDRVLAGFEKKSKVITDKEKKIVAYHEAGHAVIGWFLEHADPLLKVTIVPRSGGSLGFAQYLPNETGLVETQSLRDRICMALGGRASEEINFGRISTGASDDIMRTTTMARAMVETYGMSDALYNFSSSGLNNGGFDRGYSEKTAELIDAEAHKIISEEYERAKSIIEQRKDLVTALSLELLDKETLNHDDIVAILGARPYETDAYVKYVEQFKALKEMEAKKKLDEKKEDTKEEKEEDKKEEKKD